MTQVTPTTAQLATALAAVLNTQYPVLQVADLVSGETSSRSGRTFFTLPVSQDLGIFAAVIASVDLRVYYEKIDDHRDDAFQGGYWINAALSYTHPGGGSNGSDVATVWLDRDFNFTALRFPDGRQVKGEIKEAA